MLALTYSVTAAFDLLPFVQGKDALHTFSDSVVGAVVPCNEREARGGGLICRQAQLGFQVAQCHQQLRTDVKPGTI